MSAVSPDSAPPQEKEAKDPKPRGAKRQIIALDLITDRTQSRLFNAVAFSLIFIVVANLVLVFVLRDPKFRKGLEGVDEITDFVQPATRATMGAQFDPIPKFRVKNFQGFGIESAQVQVEVLETYVISNEFKDLDCQPTDSTTLRAKRQLLICQASPEVGTGAGGLVSSSASEQSVDGGIVSFAGFRLNHGPPGRYLLDFQVVKDQDDPSREVVTRSFETVMDTIVDKLEFTGNRQPATVTMGEPITDNLKIKVTDVNGEPLANRRVTAVSWLVRISDLGTASFWLPDVEEEKFAELENTMELTDENGEVDFSQLTVLGSNNKFVYIKFVCEGVSLNLYPDITTPMQINSENVMVDGGKLEIIAASMPKVAPEGFAFTSKTQPRIKLTDKDGNPVVGKKVYAEISTRAGKKVPPFFITPQNLNARKELTNPISEPSNDEGIARFTNLGTTVPGQAGNFKLRFACDGVKSEESSDINIVTTVIAVQSEWTLPDRLAQQDGFKTFPRITIRNSAGLGIRGKTPSLIVLQKDPQTPVTSVTFETKAQASNKAGVATFTKMFLKVAQRDNYRFMFSVDGISSTPTKYVLLGAGVLDEFNLDLGGSRRREIQSKALAQIDLDKLRAPGNAKAALLHHKRMAKLAAENRPAAKALRASKARLNGLYGSGAESYGYGGDSYGGDSYGGDSYGGDSFGGDIYGGEGYGGEGYGGEGYGGEGYGGEGYGGEGYGGEGYGGEGYGSEGYGSGYEPSYYYGSGYDPENYEGLEELYDDFDYYYEYDAYEYDPNASAEAASLADALFAYGDDGEPLFDLTELAPDDDPYYGGDYELAEGDSVLVIEKYDFSTAEEPPEAPPVAEDEIVDAELEAELFGECSKVTRVTLEREGAIGERFAADKAPKFSFKNGKGEPIEGLDVVVSLAAENAPSVSFSGNTATTDANGEATFTNLVVDGGYEASVPFIFHDVDGDCFSKVAPVLYKNPVANLNIGDPAVGGRRRSVPAGPVRAPRRARPSHSHVAGKPLRMPLGAGSLLAGQEHLVSHYVDAAKQFPKGQRTHAAIQDAVRAKAGTQVVDRAEFMKMATGSAPVAAGRKAQLELREVNEGEAIPLELDLVQSDGTALSGYAGQVFIARYPAYVYEQGYDAFFDDFPVLDPSTVNSNGNSDANGKLTWTGVRFNTGYPGEYTIGMRIAGVVGPSVRVLVRSRVASISVTTQPNKAADKEVVDLGKPFPVQPVVRLLDSNGNGVSGYRVYAAATVDPLIAMAVNMVTANEDTHGPYGGQLSARSNANGDATFTYLGFVGARRTIGDASYNLKFSFGEDDGTNDFFVESAATTTNLKVSDRLRVIIDDQGSAATAPRSRYYNPPVIHVEDPDGNCLSDFVAQATIFSTPGNQTGAVLRNQVIAVSAGAGNCGSGVFKDLMFETGPVGSYTLIYQIAGDNSEESTAVRLTDRAFSILFKDKIPAVINVGEVFHTSARVAISSGAGLPRKTVSLEIVTDAGNGALDRRRIRNDTDDTGLVNFNSVLAAGMDGVYTFRMTADDRSVKSAISKTVVVRNAVETIEFVTKPGVAKGFDKITVGKKESLVQPKVLVTDADGRPLANRKVRPLIKTPGNAGLGWNARKVTTAEGVLQFTDLYFTKGSRGEYNVTFVVDGIEANEVFLIDLENTLEPNTDALKGWQMLVVLTVLLITPMWAGTSLWIHEWAIVLSVIMSIGFMVFASVISGEVFSSDTPDAFSILLRVLLIIVMVFLVAFSLFLTANVAMKKPEKYYYNQRQKAYANLAKRQMMNKTALETYVKSDPYFKKLQDKQDVKAAKYKEFVDREKPVGAKAKIVDALKTKFVYVTKPPQDIEMFQTKRDFYYSQRFLFAAVLSLVTLFLMFLFSVLLILLAGFTIDEAKEQLIEKRIAANEAGIDTETIPRLAGEVRIQTTKANEIASTLRDESSSAADDMAAFADELAQFSLKMDEAAEAAENLGDLASEDSEAYEQIISVTETIDLTLSEESLDELKRVVMTAGFITAFLTYFLLNFVWYLMFKKYRTNIMRLRMGQFDYGDQAAYQKWLPAANYIGVQTSHSLFAFLVLFFVLWIVLIVIVFDDSRIYIWNQVRVIVISIISVSLFTKIAMTIIYNKILTGPGMTVKNRTLFALAELAQTLLSIITGLGAALIRLAMLIAGFLGFYMRLDIPLVPHPWEAKDPGFMAYTAALMVDFMYNSPLVEMALACFTNDPKLKEHSMSVIPPADPELASDPKKVADIEAGGSTADGAAANKTKAQMVARARWHLAYTLHNNPSLRAHRRQMPHWGAGKAYEGFYDDYWNKMDKLGYQRSTPDIKDGKSPPPLVEKN